MSEYIDKNEAVGEVYLADWYIHSVAEYDDEKLNEPRWTEKHIEELTQDFIVIPKDTPGADVTQVVHAHWIENSSEYYKLCYSRGQTPEQTEYLTESDVACSACLRKFNITDNSFTHECANYCPNCGARMEGGGTNGADH